MSARRWRHGAFNSVGSGHHAVRRPIQRLHLELLAEIFTYCIPEDIVNGRYRSISIRDAPILLCRVCSFWYSLAISTPRLWQRFFIDESGLVYIHRQYRPVLESIPRGIRTWLGRSGALPLNIRFGLSAAINRTIVIKALEALFEFSSRWNSVMIEVSPSVPWPHLGVLPKLQVYNGSFLPITQFPFASAPSLTVLQVYKLPPNPVSISRIPWSQLTELIVDLVAPALAVLDIVRSCPLLENLTIPVGNDEADDGSSSLPLLSVPTIKHDTLRLLWLYIMTDFGPMAIEHLILPALKILHLGGCSGKFDPYCHARVLDLVTRSKCNLQTLSIMQSALGPDCLLEYLKHPSCQTLTSLEISDYDEGGRNAVSVLDKRILSRLTYSKKRGKALLCPRLTKLCLTTCYRSEVSSAANAMGRMVLSRCVGRASNGQLRSLDLVTRYPISREDNELLQRAQDEGGLRLSYTAQEDYPEEEEMTSNPCYDCFDAGVPNGSCYCCYGSEQEDEIDEDWDEEFYEKLYETLYGEGSKKDSDDDDSEEDSDDDSEDSDDDDSEDSDDDDSEDSDDDDNEDSDDDDNEDLDEESGDDGGEEDSHNDNSGRAESGIKLMIRLPKIQTSNNPDRAESGIKLTIRLPKIQTLNDLDLEEGSDKIIERQLGWKWGNYSMSQRNQRQGGG